MFTGLSAFPLSPLGHDGLDEPAFAGLMARLVAAQVDSICALGSTGNYAYLAADQRRRITQLAVAHADHVPVVIGIGALTTDDVLAYAEHAQHAGADGLLLPPMSYQPLQAEEVFTLYESVSRMVDIPICVYDNPTTTHFEFSDELHAAIARLPNIGSIKIPGVPADPDAAAARIKDLKAQLPSGVTVGVSGDAFAARGLNAGCDAWYSVVGGLFPEAAQAITQAARAGQADLATKYCDALAPLWQLYKQHGGSLRVIATAAEQLGLVGHECLPRPLHTLDDAGRRALADVLETLALH